ncbi:Transmembrane protein 53-B [Colletotrichum spinosum]|uniref:Transmembrane protein 53-B n=1 Tax=Colletotrichum spinosum TaxID=1347390 RepID=A0A4R8QI57_9PEZI|nr:Transmembrane protein 53-B [Colletotrichum spinosum]
MASNQPNGSAGPLPPMKPLSPNTFLYEPPSARPDPNAPKLIALFGWMSAQDVHIAKYTSRYMALYPTARILLVRCPFIHTLSPRIAKREIKPAVSVIRALADATSRSETRPQLLLHVFSNGGATNLAKFYELYADADRAGRLELPPHVTVYDSCPGGFHWMRSYRALSAALPKFLAPLVHVVIAWFWVFQSPFGRHGFIGRMWTALKQKALLQSELRRVYLYSREDEMIYWADVEKHAAESKDVGFRVTKEKFDGSKHVAHAKLDGDRYWGSVRKLWDGEKEVSASEAEKPSTTTKPEVTQPVQVAPEAKQHEVARPEVEKIQAVKQQDVANPEVEKIQAAKQQEVLPVKPLETAKQPEEVKSEPAPEVIAMDGIKEPEQQQEKQAVQPEVAKLPNGVKEPEVPEPTPNKQPEVVQPEPIKPAPVTPEPVRRKKAPTPPPTIQ